MLKNALANVTGEDFYGSEQSSEVRAAYLDHMRRMQEDPKAKAGNQNYKTPQE